MNNEPKSIIIEGNIGVGKSTFLRLINDLLDVQVVYEPHTKWQDIGGENLLDYFYKDTNRWAYTFQSYAFVSRITEQEEALAVCKNQIQILERSVYSDRYCFAKNAFEIGSMSPLEWNLYKNWWAWFVKHYTKKPAGFVYLQTDPEVCYERLKKRARSEEVCVTLDYLKQLHDKHESWLIQKQGIEDYLQNIPVLVLDCSQEFENNAEVTKKFAEKIVDFCAFNTNLDLKVSNKLSLL